MGARRGKGLHTITPLLSFYIYCANRFSFESCPRVNSISNHWKLPRLTICRNIREMSQRADCGRTRLATQGAK